jgi:hypothetical protein
MPNGSLQSQLGVPSSRRSSSSRIVQLAHAGQVMGHVLSAVRLYQGTVSGDAPEPVHDRSTQFVGPASQHVPHPSSDGERQPTIAVDAMEISS